MIRIGRRVRGVDWWIVIWLFFGEHIGIGDCGIMRSDVEWGIGDGNAVGTKLSRLTFKWDKAGSSVEMMLELVLKYWFSGLIRSWGCRWRRTFSWKFIWVRMIFLWVIFLWFTWVRMLYLTVLFMFASFMFVSRVGLKRWLEGWVMERRVWKKRHFWAIWPGQCSDWTYLSKVVCW